MDDSSSINQADQADVTELTAGIVSAYVANNALSSTDLPKLIADVHAAMTAIASGVVEEPIPELKPVVSIRKSVTPDFIVCLEDGQKYKSLKRHLQTAHGLSPEGYREKWGLPLDYPMVAPNYSAARSQLAMNAGLGRKPAAPVKVARPRKAKAAAPVEQA